MKKKLDIQGVHGRLQTDIYVILHFPRLRVFVLRFLEFRNPLLLEESSIVRDYLLRGEESSI